LAITIATPSILAIDHGKINYDVLCCELSILRPFAIRWSLAHCDLLTTRKRAYLADLSGESNQLRIMNLPTFDGH
jgi:hypothetical protein